MREQAHLIQGEVARLMDDLGRLDERVRKLQTHFLQTSKDIDDILVSSGKVSRRGAKIEALEFGGPLAEDAIAIEEGVAAKADKVLRTADSKTGQLRLRVVEDGD
jgi:DNA recombination protein RmuC